MSLGLGLALTNRQAAAGGGGAVPFERVSNGTFDNDVGWDTSGAAWTIAGGVAVNNTAGMFLTTTLMTPLAGGESFTVSVDGVGNPNATGWIVSLYNSGTLASQQILIAGPPNATKTNSGTVSGAFDQLRIAAVDDPDLVIDNVSLIA